MREADRQQGPQGEERRWADLPRAAGWAVLVERPRGPTIAGWIVDPVEGPFESVCVVLDGIAAGDAVRSPSPGLGRSAPWIPDAAKAGVLFALDRSAERPARLELVGRRGGTPAGRHLTMLSSPAAGLAVPPRSIAAPSSELAKRTGEGNGERIWERDFLAGGMGAAAGLLEQIERHLGGAEGLRLLDWGCGCGRVARHMLGQGFESVAGCDLDGQAIAWCRENLPAGEFVVSSPEPPLPFDDGSMDVIVGCSVMTHLDGPMQDRWLAELRRVSAPGALLLLSTQGETAYQRAALGRLSGVLRHAPALARLAAAHLGRRLRRKGIVDRGAKRELAGIAPHGYYRAIAQSPEHTRERWAPHFDVLDVVERGLDGHQDLVVMRRRRGH